MRGLQINLHIQNYKTFYMLMFNPQHILWACHRTCIPVNVVVLCLSVTCFTLLAYTADNFYFWISSHSILGLLQLAVRCEHVFIIKGNLTTFPFSILCMKMKNNEVNDRERDTSRKKCRWNSQIYSSHKCLQKGEISPLVRSANRSNEKSV